MKRSLFGMVAVVCSALVLIGLGRYLLRSDHDTAQTIPYHRGAHPPLVQSKIVNRQYTPPIHSLPSLPDKDHRDTRHVSSKFKLLNSQRAFDNPKVMSTNISIHRSSNVYSHSYGVATPQLTEIESSKNGNNHSLSYTNAPLASTTTYITTIPMLAYNHRSTIYPIEADNLNDDGSNAAKRRLPGEASGGADGGDNNTIGEVVIGEDAPINDAWWLLVLLIVCRKFNKKSIIFSRK